MPTVFKANNRVETLDAEIKGISRKIKSLVDNDGDVKLIKNFRLKKDRRMDDLYVAVKHLGEAKEKFKVK